MGEVHFNCKLQPVDVSSWALPIPIGVVLSQNTTSGRRENNNCGEEMQSKFSSSLGCSL